MPTYTVKAPDGKTVTLQGPAGASQAEIIAQAQRLYKPTAAPKPAPARPPVKTREQEIREIARSNIDARRKQRQQAGMRISPQEEAMGAGVSNFLGLGPLASAGTNFIGDILSGRPTEFKRDLDVARTENRILRDQGPAQAFAGEVISGFGGGGLAAKGLQAGARALAPVAPRVSQAIRSATTLQRGQKAKNVARIAGAGAAGGAAQSAGEGSDISTGAAYGAGGALALGGAAKGLGWLGGKAANIYRGKAGDAVDKFLAKQIGVSKEWLKEAADEFRKKTGKEATVFELLPFEVRESLKKTLRRTPGNQRGRAAELARARVEAIPGEITDVVEASTRPVRKNAARTMASDLAASRGGDAPTFTEQKLAVAATKNKNKLDQLRDVEAGNIMKPYDDLVAFQSVDEMLPASLVQTKLGKIREKVDDPEIARVIKGAAGLAQLRPKGKGITVSETAGVIRKLKKQVDNPDDIIKSGAAQKAIDHLEAELAKRHPDVMPAYARMNEQYAGKSRQYEGMKSPSLSEKFDGGRQLFKNVYETPEGSVGRSSGQRLQTLSTLGKEPSKALGAVRDLAKSPDTARQLQQNLGRESAEAITTAAQTQSESARKLVTMLAEQPSSIDSIEAGDLVPLMAAFNPASMLYTKAGAAMRIMDAMKSIPESRAKVIVDMLFSRDPAMTQRAINALRAAGDEGSQALRGLTQAIAAGVLSAPGSEEVTEASPDIPPAVENTEEANTFDQFGETEETGESPYEQELQDLYELEDPELLDLIDRVEQQESGGDQSAVSSAGAIGVMQVMPGTAPEAAELAGLPWDEEAYYSDPAYNKLLGIAYLSEMLRRYDGDVNLALAAYNAGPGRADEYAAGRGNLPAETQDYISRIAG